MTEAGRWMRLRTEERMVKILNTVLLGRTVILFGSGAGLFRCATLMIGQLN